MRYKYAKTLHNEDEVIVKATGEVLNVFSVEKDDGKNLFLLCSDGNVYNHKELV